MILSPSDRRKLGEIGMWMGIRAVVIASAFGLFKIGQFIILRLA